MAFVRRYLSFTFVLSPQQAVGNISANPNPTFSGTGSNTVTVTGTNGQPIWAAAIINRFGNQGGGQMSAHIRGMPLSLMNQLTTLGKPTLNGSVQTGANQVSVQAWSDDTAPSLIFQGTINEAWTEFNSMPDTPFVLHSMEVYPTKLALVPPHSYSGSVQVQEVVGQLAGEAGLTFENNNVTAVINSPYLPGNLHDQVHRICKATNTGWCIQGGTLAIWPYGAFRSQQVVVGPPNHYQSNFDGIYYGYPDYTTGGVKLKCSYLPSAVFNGQCVVQGSSVTPANGTWTIGAIEDHLDTAPNGEWFTYLTLYVDSAHVPT